MNLHPIFKRKIAMDLRELGNPIIDASSNERNPKFVVYYFEETEKFKIDLENLSKYNKTN